MFITHWHEIMKPFVDSIDWVFVNMLCFRLKELVYLLITLHSFMFNYLEFETSYLINNLLILVSFCVNFGWIIYLHIVYKYQCIESMLKCYKN